jgi:hypothetical protein
MGAGEKSLDFDNVIFALRQVKRQSKGSMHNSTFTKSYCWTGINRGFSMANVLLNIEQVDWLEPFSQSSDKYGIWPWDLFIYEPERYSKPQTYIPRVYVIVCSLVRIGTPHPLSHERMCPPPWTKRGGGAHSYTPNSDIEKA